MFAPRNTQETVPAGTSTNMTYFKMRQPLILSTFYHRLLFVKNMSDSTQRLLLHLPFVGSR